MNGEVNINLQAISMWLQGWRAARELRKTLAKLPELRCKAACDGALKRQSREFYGISDNVCYIMLHIYIYMCVYIYLYMYICMYIYIYTLYTLYINMFGASWDTSISEWTFWNQLCHPSKFRWFIITFLVVCFLGYPVWTHQLSMSCFWQGRVNLTVDIKYSGLIGRLHHSWKFVRGTTMQMALNEDGQLL